MYFFSSLVSDAYIRRLRILYPGKVIIADTRVKRQVFKPLEMDLDKIFRKQTRKITHSEPVFNDNKNEILKCQDSTEIQANGEEYIDTNNNNQVAKDIAVLNDPNRNEGKLNKAQQEPVKDVDVAVNGNIHKVCTKDVIGTRSDSELLQQGWVKDLLYGNLPTVKGAKAQTPHNALSVIEVHKNNRSQDKNHNVLSTMKNFGRELKIKFSRKSHEASKYDFGDVRV